MQNTAELSVMDNKEVPALPFKLKIMNRINILKCFRDGKGHTVSEVSGLTGISKITTMRAVHFFCEQGVLDTQGKVYQNNTGGKYPEIFRLNITQYILSITLWSEEICFTLMDFYGTVIERFEYENINLNDMSLEEIQNFLLDEIRSLLDKADVDKDKIYGAAVSTSGTVDYQNKRIRYTARAAGWGNNISILDPLKEFFGENTYFFIDNGSKTLARAFLLRPDVRNKRTLIFTTTCGMAGCFIQDGKILSGKNSLIGEIGHMVLDANDREKCSCGSYGCFEKLVDISRIREMIKERGLTEDSPLGRIPWDQVELRDLFNLANEGDALSREYVAYLANWFAIILKNISLVFDTELLFFVGEYAYAGQYFDQCLRDKMKEFRYYTDKEPFEIKYEEESMLKLDYIGASVAVTDHFFNNAKLYEGD